MNALNLLLGYDAREAWISFESSWSAERRLRFLLRQEIEKPLSVDSDVWPSVFELVTGLKRPDWTGYVQDLWDNLDALTSTLQSQRPVELTNTRFIAVELVASMCSAEALAEWRDRVRDVVPPRLDQLPRRLAGYDVADFFLLSGLTNCETPMRPNLSRWAPLLNQYHLFSDPAPALEFKAEVDQRMPKHAPFFVFALWLLEPAEGLP
jgi:hypothetical protein